ncbi:MAG: hypothetical protein IPL26_24110 [Leptospiraceae bacterium]|nr:hypothetical protein [Leptospiraceae bacterium]
MKWEEEGTELLITESDTGMEPGEKIFRQIETVGLLLSFNPAYNIHLRLKDGAYFW